MSFILNAIKKQNAQKTVSEPMSVAKSEHFKWALLLIATVLIAVFVGFWMGQQQAGEAVVTTKGAVSSNQAAEIKRQVNKTDSSDIKPVKNNQTNMAIAAASYFDKPPTTNNKNKESAKQQKVEIIHHNPKAVNFAVKAEPGVSPELLAQFNQAIEETAPEIEQHKQIVTEKKSTNIAVSSYQLENLPSISELPSMLLQQIPTLNFSQHVYASNHQGWVKCNGQERQEGQQIADNITLVEILPQKLVLKLNDTYFTMQALGQWQ